MTRYIYINRTTTYPYFDDVNNGNPFSFAKYFAATKDIKTFILGEGMYFEQLILGYETEKWLRCYPSLLHKVDSTEYKKLLQCVVPAGKIYKGDDDVYGEEISSNGNKVVKILSTEDVVKSRGQTAWCSGDSRVLNDILRFWDYYFVRTNHKFKTGYKKLAVFVEKQNKNIIIQNSFSETITQTYCDTNGNLVYPFEYRSLEDLGIKI